jgi:CDP-glucose 4,6-dehydratase
MRAALARRPLVLRNPGAVRPWQHVLNPLSGYLVLAQRLIDGDGAAEAWNFGPAADDARPVSWLVDRIRDRWPGEPPEVRVAADPDAGKESVLLRLDSAKARERLGWTPGWDLQQGLDATVEWYAAPEQSARERTTRQIDAFTAAAS